MLLSQDKLDHRDSVSKHGKSLRKTKQKTTHNQAQTKRPRLLQQSKTERSHHCCNSAKAVKTPGVYSKRLQESSCTADLPPTIRSRPGLECFSSHPPHNVGTHHPRFIGFQRICPESKSRYSGKPSTHKYPNQLLGLNPSGNSAPRSHSLPPPPRWGDKKKKKVKVKPCGLR